MEDIRDFSKDELEKLKLREEIRKLKNPLWKEISFISIIATLIIAFASASISIWRLKSNKISELELQKEILLKEKKQVQLESENTNKLYNEALAEKSNVLSQKSQIQNQINELNKINLIEKENTLRKDIRKLDTEKKRMEAINSELKQKIDGYKKGFIESFMQNEFVQNDIDKFITQEQKAEGVLWLKSKLIWTALVNYENYIFEQSQNLINQ